MTRGQAFCAVALEGLIQLQANELGLCALSPDVEYVHQARVALRRLRSALRLFGPALPASFGRRWAPVWQMHARSLGLARDWDVFCTEWMPRLKTLPGTDTAMSWLETHALAQRAAAHAAVQRRLADPRHARALRAFRRDVKRLARRSSHGLTDKAWARDRLDRLHRKVTRGADRVISLDVEERHALRIRLKRLRYALDFLASLFPAERVRRYREALAQAQELLGQLNDLATVQRLLLDAPPADVAALQPWLYGEQERLLSLLPAALRPLQAAARPWRKRG